MEALLLLFAKNSEHKSGRADSFSDKFNSKYTVCLLSLFAIISTTRLYIDEPISCFCPSDWSSSEIAFAEKTCWTQNTFFVPMSQYDLHRNQSHISYYQWMPLIFAFQAFLFFIPSSLWKILSKKPGLKLTSITDACLHSRRCADLDDTKAAVKFASHNMDSFLRALDSRYVTSNAVKAFIRGRSLSLLYVLVKCIYLSNAFGQLYYLDNFLDNGYHYYGLTVMSRMIHNQRWSVPQSFPRITYCNVVQRVLGNMHRYTLQCTLPMNLYYSMMLLFLWFWLVLVMVLTTGSLIRWTVVLFVPRFRRSHVSEFNVCAELTKTNPTYANEKISQFADYLKTDGFFIIRMVEGEAGEWIASRVVREVWDKFLERQVVPRFNFRNANAPDEGFESCKTSEISSNTTFEDI